NGDHPSDHDAQFGCAVLVTDLPSSTFAFVLSLQSPAQDYEMKALMAAIALLCVSSTVLAHDIYSTLRDRHGHLCSAGQDCKPVEATVLPIGSDYLQARGEIVPQEVA